MSWSRPFDNPIPTAKGQTLVMLKMPRHRRTHNAAQRTIIARRRWYFPWPGPQNPQQPNVAGDSQGRMRSEPARGGD